MSPATEDTMDLRPAFAERNVAIALAADDYYAAPLGVTVASVLAHSDPGANYDFIVLDDGIREGNRRRLRSLMRNNSAIRFVDMRRFLADMGAPDFHVSHYISVASYYRIFLPGLLPEHERVLYLDSDLVALGDVTELYRADFGGNPLAAVWDMYMAYNTQRDDDSGRKLRRYLAETLGLAAPADYFQAGVLACNLAAMRADGFTERCLDFLRRVPRPLFHDQCTLNAVCRGRVARLGLEWNFLWETGLRTADFAHGLPPGRREEYLSVRERPKMVHYCSGIKAWTRVDAEQSDFFWHSARTTPFYPELLGRFQRLETARALSAAAWDRDSAWPALLKTEMAGL